jgi:CheY-like chemotaxis protein
LDKPEDLSNKIPREYNLYNPSDPTQENHADPINFINYTQKYCLGFIDIVNSTKETAKIKEPNKLRKYYSLFLNTMSSVINDYNGKIVKNGGDNLFFYFPETSQSNNESSIHETLICAFTMIGSHTSLNNKLLKESLPNINYRISMDYGEVEIAISSKTNDVDLFGTVVNECAKMNRLALPNGLIIGQNLYEKINNSYFIENFSINKINTKNDNVNGNKQDMPLFATYAVSMNQQVTELSNPQKNYNYQLKSDIAKGSEEQKDKKISKLYNIILIDDDEDILYTFQTVLEMEGYKVKSYSKPIDAFKYIIESKNPNTYDLVLLDIRMPGLNGIQLYYRLKAMNPNAKILFVSALEIVQELLEALPEIKSEQIIKKPVDRENFLSKVKSILN